MTVRPGQILRPGVPAALAVAALRPGAGRRQRMMAGAGLTLLWSAVYLRYRRGGRITTRREWELLRTANWEAFSRHYNERVPTVEEELDLWGDYHRHRHEMRYDLVAEATSAHLGDGGRVLDVGCGAAMVADRLLHRRATYVGLDFGGHHIAEAAKKHGAGHGRLGTAFARGNAEGLPFPDRSFDTVVMSEVIEHLLRPELAVWEVARVLRPGGILVMTTNNASEVPLRSPLSHLPAWLEKAFGAYHPKLISHRPWIWPEKLDPSILPPGAPDVYLPHTHHIFAETRDLFAAAGLTTFGFSTFEFPPPQAATSRWLDGRGEQGRRMADLIERVATTVPLLNRLGCHMLVLARKTAPPVAPEPPPGLWPGPLSGGAGDDPV